AREVDGREQPLRRREEARDVGFVGEVHVVDELDAIVPCEGTPFELARVEDGGHAARARLEEPRDHGAPERARPAGDDDLFALEIHDRRVRHRVGVFHFGHGRLDTQNETCSISPPRFPNMTDPQTEIPAPLRLRDVASFDDEADVIVVGFGGAGACAALEARAAGADVLVLDRFDGGGATAISGGVFYAGGGTRVQREAKVEDSVEAMYEYLKLEVKGVVSDETLRDFCEQSSRNLEWLSSHGVPFEGSLCPVKTSYPTDDYYLYYSGNEGFAPYKDAAKPAPRGHRAKGKGLPGENFYAPLRESAIQKGVRVSFLTLVTRLVLDDEGEVVGVEAQVVEDRVAATLLRGLYSTAMALRNYSPQTARACY